MRKRVREAAELLLSSEKSVGPIEVLNQVGFLAYQHIELWKQGASSFETLEPYFHCGDKKLKATFAAFDKWVKESDLEPFQADYLRASRDGAVQLQVTSDGDPEREAFFRTHYRPANLTEKQKERIQKKKNKTPDLLVFQLVGEPCDCRECGVGVDKGEMFYLEQQQPICLDCADLAHLEFLPSGDATLTRRSRKHSPLTVVVKRFNQRRKKYDRRGILVTAQAIEAARAQNESDAEQRARIREQAELRRQKLDTKLVNQMQTMILADFPNCPPDEAAEIAMHTAERGSGRVGRSAAGRRLEAKPIELAVFAWIRHQHTEYDSLLMDGVERQMARDLIRHKQQEVIREWKGEG